VINVPVPGVGNVPIPVGGNSGLPSIPGLPNVGIPNPFNT
jgi:hypothetical protein